MEKEKQELINLIEQQTNFLVNDVNTYIWLKAQLPEEYDKAANEHKIGGGNFIITMATFSLFDMLGQIYRYLRKGNEAGIGLNHEHCF